MCAPSRLGATDSPGPQRWVQGSEGVEKGLAQWTLSPSWSIRLGLWAHHHQHCRPGRWRAKVILRQSTDVAEVALSWGASE